eukprot:scaffold271_cov336-Pavlova_lutheri.AAC.25
MRVRRSSCAAIAVLSQSTSESNPSHPIGWTSTVLGRAEKVLGRVRKWGWDAPRVGRTDLRLCASSLAFPPRAPRPPQVGRDTPPTVGTYPGRASGDGGGGRAWGSSGCGGSGRQGTEVLRDRGARKYGYRRGLASRVSLRLPEA